MRPDEMIDAELGHRFVAGDESAFLELMRRHRPMVFGRALQLLANREDAEEVTQDTFASAHRNMHRFRFECALGSWFYRITTNLSHNRYQHGRRRRRDLHDSLHAPLPGADDVTIADVLPSDGPTATRELCAAEFSALVPLAVQRMKARHREVISLWLTGNWKYDTLATHLGVNIGTIKSRLARARENLLQELRTLCPEFAHAATAAEWMEKAS